jgi:FXSXX-COOH protein
MADSESDVPTLMPDVAETSLDVLLALHDEGETVLRHCLGRLLDQAGHPASEPIAFTSAL